MNIGRNSRFIKLKFNSVIFSPFIILSTPIETNTPVAKSSSKSWNWLIKLKIPIGDDIVINEVPTFAPKLTPAAAWVAVTARPSAKVRL